MPSSMKTVFSFLLLFLQSWSFGRNDICVYVQFGADHTMCKYTARACPPGLLPSDITDEDKATVLKTHNTLRQKVATGKQTGQPSASNMEEMKWDDELATIAQRWAEQCVFEHDTNRRTDTFTYVGQNIAIIGSTAGVGTTDFNRTTYMWYDEVTKPGFCSSKIDPFKFEMGTGHYTQVVWATSNRIGCGVASYKDAEYYQTIYVCNYGPGGNMKGAAMYKNGTAASACLSGKSTAYPGLCSS